MPIPSSSPGVYVQERAPPPRVIESLPTSITLFIGNTASGPREVAVKVSSLIDYRTAFGTAGDLDGSIAHYFANGGQVAWIIASPSRVGTAAFHAELSKCFDAGGPVDAIDRFQLLCVPGESDPATQAALQMQCASRRVFYIADCAADATAASLGRGPDPQLLGANASWSALYAPWVVAIDPASSVSRSFPPSAFVAGVCARIDAQRGVWKAAAGTEATVIGATGLAIPIDARVADAMNAAGIDALRALPNRSIVIWGARTLAGAGGDPDYRYVSVRRLMLFIETSIEAGLTWIVFEPNIETTWATLRASIAGLLDGLWRQGALSGVRSGQAWYVRCDTTTMTQADIEAGRLIVMVGVAPLRPAEFVVLRLCFMTAT